MSYLQLFLGKMCLKFEIKCKFFSNLRGWFRDVRKTVRRFFNQERSHSTKYEDDGSIPNSQANAQSKIENGRKRRKSEPEDQSFLVIVNVTDIPQETVPIPTTVQRSQEEVKVQGQRSLKVRSPSRRTTMDISEDQVQRSQATSFASNNISKDEDRVQKQSSRATSSAPKNKQKKDFSFQCQDSRATNFPSKFKVKEQDRAEGHSFKTFASRKLESYKEKEIKRKEFLLRKRKQEQKDFPTQINRSNNVYRCSEYYVKIFRENRLERQKLKKLIDSHEEKTPLYSVRGTQTEETPPTGNKDVYLNEQYGTEPLIPNRKKIVAKRSKYGADNSVSEKNDTSPIPENEILFSNRKKIVENMSKTTADSERNDASPNLSENESENNEADNEIVYDRRLLIDNESALARILQTNYSVKSTEDDGKKTLIIDDTNLSFMGTQFLINLLYENVNIRCPMNHGKQVDAFTQTVTPEENILEMTLDRDVNGDAAVTSIKTQNRQSETDSQKRKTGSGSDSGIADDGSLECETEEKENRKFAEDLSDNEEFDIPKGFEDYLSYMRVTFFQILREQGKLQLMLADIGRHMLFENKRDHQDLKTEFRKRIHKEINRMVNKCIHVYNKERCKPSDVKEFLGKYFRSFRDKQIVGKPKGYNLDVDVYEKQFENLKCLNQEFHRKMNDLSGGDRRVHSIKAEKKIEKESEKNDMKQADVVSDVTRDETDSVETGSSCGSVEDIEHELEEMEKEMRNDKWGCFSLFGQTDGVFDRGAEYWIDGQAAIGKSRKGARGDYNDKPKKKKTRGIPNKHLKNIVAVTEEGQNCDEEEIIDVKGAVDDEVNIDYGEGKNVNVDTVIDEDLNVDTRHLETLPTDVILGKKDDCEHLGFAYAPLDRRSGKPRANKPRKRQQRANRQTKLTFGLNTNNCADDEYFSSDNDDDSEYELESRISFHTESLCDDTTPLI